MFTEVRKSDIPAYTKGKKGEYAMPTMQEFYESGIEAAVVDFPGKSVKTVYNSLKQAQKRSNLPVEVSARSGKVYLIRKDGD